MYTGIVQAMLPIASLKKLSGLSTFSLLLPDSMMAELETGASVAVNGTCFTVTQIAGTEVFFDAIEETLALTNLKAIEVGTQVNVERSARANAEVGGHVLSGHVVGTAVVVAIDSSENNQRLTFRGEPAWTKYVFNKGYLALNGASLTIAEAVGDEFAVNLIPETLRRTNFALLSEGDLVNVEIEQQTQVIVDTVERVLAERLLSTSGD
ncbi:MAG: riboflavin synthase [Candidatus Azotimanducaceae bacterium]|jgi:riboflavin synthase